MSNQRFFYLASSEHLINLNQVTRVFIEYESEHDYTHNRVELATGTIVTLSGDEYKALTNYLTSEDAEL